MKWINTEDIESLTKNAELDYPTSLRRAKIYLNQFLFSETLF